ncbi:hypothetical protein ACTQ6A_05350 [Lachnospiraceae bacterium LCP25S3_G4]
MSQEKVDRYKKEKANRKKSMQKEKIMSVVRKCTLAIAGLVIVGWLGYSGYNTYESKQPRGTVEVNYTAVQEYVSGLQQ